MAKAPCKKRAKTRYKKRQTAKRRGVQGDDFTLSIQSSDINGGLLTVQSLMQAYVDKKIDRSVYTGLLYGMSIAVSWVRMQTEQDLQKRLDAIEARMNEGANRYGNIA